MPLFTLLLLACPPAEDSGSPPKNDDTALVDTGTPCTVLTLYADLDGDGFGSGEATEACELAGHVANDEDCDDGDASVFPTATEWCDGIDNDCDGDTDEGAAGTYYADADGDGTGDPATAVASCDRPAGFVANGNDCDDSNPAAFPAAVESCDGADNDCDGEVDENTAGAPTWYADDDGDGFGDPRQDTVACHPPDGSVADHGDCDDTSASVYPGATESCDGTDEDCDGEVDNDASGASTWYLDADGDGFGDPGVTSVDCDAPSSYVADNSDCDDTDPSVNYDAAEWCDNGVDDNCDGVTDETGTADGGDLANATYSYCADNDGDGFGSDVDIAAYRCEDDPTLGYPETCDDCDDGDPSAGAPSQEDCGDGIDNDCDGNTDEWELASGSGLVTYYLDEDEDGYGGETSTNYCTTDPAAEPFDDYPADNTASEGGDCDDTDASVSPGAEEVADGVDNDCDGEVDE